MSSGRDVRIKQMNNAAQAVSVGYSSEILQAKEWQMDGFFSCYVKTTSAGAAVLKVEYMVSFDGSNFYIPQDKTGTALLDSVIVIAHAVGIQVYEFHPIMAPYYKLRLSVSGADATLVQVNIAGQ